MKIKFFHRLFASHVTVVVITIALIFVSLHLFLPNMFYNMKVDELKETGTYMIEEQLWTHKQPGQPRDRARLDVQVVERGHNGRGGRHLSIQPEEWERLNEGNILSYQQDRQRFDVPVTLVIMPVEQNVAMVLSTPISETEQVIAAVEKIIGWIFLITVVVVLLISWVLSKGLQRRIATMRKMARTIGEGKYGKQLPISGGDEISDLASDLNDMSMKLLQAEKEIQQMEQRRSQFLADISHELKTPLTSIRGMIEALRNDMVEEEEQNRLYFFIEKETLRLIRLVRSIMDVERIRSGDIELQYRTVDVVEVLVSIVEQLDVVAEEKGIKLELQVDEPIEIEADEDRVRQIVINLVKNGIQYTDKGKVAVKASSDEKNVYIDVTDTGIGMTEEQQTDIFERFYKVDPSRTFQEGEMGLGLTLVKQLVLAHDGEVSVASEKGKGSCFQVKLPRNQKARPS